MAAFGFYASAVIAVVAGLLMVVVRRRDHALAGFAITLAALLVPLIQLGAEPVAAVMLLATGAIVMVLGVLAQSIPAVAGQGQRRPGWTRRLSYWLPAGLGMLGFAWVLLATGARQVVDLGKPLPANSTFGAGDALLLELGGTFMVPAVLVGLLALCAVIAAVLGLVGKDA